MADEHKEQTEAEYVGELSKHYQDGIVTVQHVISQMPNSVHKNYAIQFFETHVIWMEKVFEQAHNMASRRDRMRAEQAAHSEDE